MLGAVASSGLVPAQEIGGETGRGRLLQGIYEYEKGVVVIEPIGQTAILVVVTSAAANLGLLRLQARKPNRVTACSRRRSARTTGCARGRWQRPE